MNNSVYNFLYDSVVNTYLIEHCGLRPKDGEQYGMVGKLVQAPERPMRRRYETLTSKLASALS